MSPAKISALGAVFWMAGMSGAVGAATIAQYDFDTPGTYTKTDGKLATTIADVSGNGFDLKYNYLQTSSTDTPFGLSTPSGNASLSLGSTDNGKPQDIASMDLNNGGINTFTIEGWMNPSTAAVRYIVQLRASQNIYLGMDADGKAWGDIYVGGVHYKITAEETLVTDAWNYLAITYDGSTLRLYTRNSNHVDADNDPVLWHAGTLAVGKALPSSFNSNTVIATGNGVTYDDIRISNVVLSDAELGYHGSFTQIPEPAGLSALALGLLMLRRRRGGAL